MTYNNNVKCKLVKCIKVIKIAFKQKNEVIWYKLKTSSIFLISQKKENIHNFNIMEFFNFNKLLK